MIAFMIVILNPAGMADCAITQVYTFHLRSFPTNLLGNGKKGISHISTTELQREFIFLSSILMLSREALASFTKALNSPFPF